MRKMTTMKLDQRLKLALEEDLGQGDLTSALLIPRQAKGQALIAAKEAGVFCGAAQTINLFRRLDPSMKITCLIKDGGSYRRHQILFRLEGKVHAILGAERTVLNLIGRLSGIATMTANYVAAVRGTGVRILDTRKTTPLWRDLEKYAVKVGGGMNHRMGLYDAVFIKENHRAFANWDNLKHVAGHFEIEVRNERELAQALKFSPRVILFDNFKPKALARLVKKLRQARGKKIIAEASGGIHLKNVRDYALTGVDWISAGALTHSVRCSDFSLLMADKKRGR